MAISIKHRETTLKHGGDIEQAAKRYGFSLDHALDMSTGISPWSWPVPEIPKEVWRQLPESHEALITAARAYYQLPDQAITAVPGSQLAIRLIPQLVDSGRVAMPELGYQEHTYSWLLAGHNPVFYRNYAQLEHLVHSAAIEHAVVITPNNPSGDTISHQQVVHISKKLSGHLVLDQAFADIRHEPIVPTCDSTPRLICLRSLGKFFGLAGIRVGFVSGNRIFIKNLESILQPWSISGPSLYIAQKALLDSQWQQRQRERITQTAHEFEPVLRSLAAAYGVTRSTHTGLFHTLFGNQIQIDKLHQDLAKIGIWARRYNDDDPQCWLRFSLPDSPSEFAQRSQRLKIS